MNMRIISLDGRLGGDAEVRKTTDGKPYVKFSVANNTFSKGKEITDWFDVNCYDPYVIQNKVKFLTKGRYVIITGNIRTEVSERNGKLWLNHFITATNVDTPSFGRQREDNSSDSQPDVSVYTGGTRSDFTQPSPQTIPSYVPQEDNYENDSDDMPF